MGESFRVGGWLVEPDRGYFRRDGRDVRVEPRAMSVLVRLARTPANSVTREALIADVWDGAFVTDEVLSSAIRKLRRALGDDAKSPRYIQTVPGVGYRLIAELRPSAHTAEPRRRWRLPALQGSLVALSVLLLAGLAISVRSPEDPDTSWVRTPATSLPGLEKDPALSPNGTLLAFAWDGGDEAALPQLYVDVVAQEREPTQLTSPPGDVERAAWSPDGGRLAYLRHIDVVTGEPIASARAIATAAHAIYVVPVLGGAPRLVGTTGFAGAHALDWSPDGRSLVFVDRSEPDDPDSLFLLDIESGERARISFPPTSQDEDSNASFSPDGRLLAFIRATAPYGHQGDLHLLTLESGELTQLSSGLGAIDVEWDSDGRSLLVVSSLEGRTVWHLDVDTRQQRKLPLVFAPDEITLSDSGTRLAYAVRANAFGVWRVSGPRASERIEPMPLIRSTRVDTEAAYSPDGRHIAFQSSRSGESRLYIADADGAHAMQMVPFRTDGMPRWSPDGAHIAVEGYPDGKDADVFVVPVAGGAPLALVASESNDTDPFFSSDGSRVYFASDRAGPLDVWSVSVNGEKAKRLTFGGGRAPQPSSDGELVYYSKTTSAQRGAIWSVPSGGSESKEVLKRRPHFKEWQLWQNAIVFVEQELEDGPAIMMKDLDSGTVELVHALGPGVRTSVGLSVSPGGEWVLFARLQTSGDIALLERRAGRWDF